MSERVGSDGRMVGRGLIHFCREELRESGPRDFFTVSGGHIDWLRDDFTLVPLATAEECDRVRAQRERLADQSYPNVFSNEVGYKVYNFVPRLRVATTCTVVCRTPLSSRWFVGFRLAEAELSLERRRVARILDIVGGVPQDWSETYEPIIPLAWVLRSRERDEVRRRFEQIRPNYLVLDEVSVGFAPTAAEGGGPGLGGVVCGDVLAGSFV